MVGFLSVKSALLEHGRWCEIRFILTIRSFKSKAFANACDVVKDAPALPLKVVKTILASSLLMLQHIMAQAHNL